MKQSIFIILLLSILFLLVSAQQKKDDKSQEKKPTEQSSKTFKNLPCGPVTGQAAPEKKTNASEGGSSPKRVLLQEKKEEEKKEGEQKKKEGEKKEQEGEQQKKEGEQQKKEGEKKEAQGAQGEKETCPLELTKANFSTGYNLSLAFNQKNPDVTLKDLNISFAVRGYVCKDKNCSWKEISRFSSKLCDMIQNKSLCKDGVLTLFKDKEQFIPFNVSQEKEKLFKIEGCCQVDKNCPSFSELELILERERKEGKNVSVEVNKTSDAKADNKTQSGNESAGGAQGCNLQTIVMISNQTKMISHFVFSLNCHKENKTCDFVEDKTLETSAKPEEGKNEKKEEKKKEEKKKEDKKEEKPKRR